ncbi:hypothetical protein ACIQF6_34005 [Kitasatospora sp. NPDC092948]|uniref:hypothetical protein n=1 Tax=Kitasatospora sp. NPDC092948 TaxID=3364088 RepID=UPI00380A909E
MSPEALLLGEPMRTRLQAAVHALLADESVAGLPDAARLAAVVVYAKGGLETGSTVLWSGELARWLGVGISMVSHKVLPPLRARGALRTSTVTNERGEAVALDMRLEPVARLRRARNVRHPLALTRSELATLLRLCEGLFGPGWEPTGKEPTPPGLLARVERKQRHGAAADRLALLLLVLSCRENGRLRLCSGSLAVPELGRGAATLALLLRGGAAPVTPEEADRVLSRLESAGVVEVDRLEGSAPSGRVTLLPVAASYAAVRPRKRPAPVRPAAPELPVPPEPEQPQAQPAAPACPAVEGVQETGAALSSPSASTDGDLESSEASEERQSGVGPAEMPSGAAGGVEPASAEFHAPHAHVVAVGSESDGEDCGFSGASAEGVTARRPERAGAREDREIPLRGEQRVIERKVGGKGSVKVRSGTDRTVAAGHVGSLLTAFGEPRDPRLSAVLAPVADVWWRIQNPSTRAFVLTKVAAELDAVTFWSGPSAAVELLAGRLDFRRRRQGAVPITDPVGWLRHRGLLKGSDCPERSCDDGIRLDTGQDCTACDLRISDRRSIRLILTRQVVAALPSDATDEQRREAVEAALAEHTRTRQEALATARHRIAAEQARWEAGRLEREARTAEAERALRALPCEDCHAPDSAGLCADCRIDRAVTHASLECLDLALVCIDPAVPEEVAAARELIAGDLRQAREQSRANALDDLNGEELGVDSRLMAELVAVEVLRDSLQVRALAHCALLPAADREAEAVHAAVMRSRHRYRTLQEAAEAASEQAHLARHRAARWVFDRRLADAIRRREQIEATGRTAADQDAECGVNGTGRALARQAVETRRAEELAADLDRAAQECVVVALAFWADLADGASRHRITERAAVTLAEVRTEARAGHGHGHGHGHLDEYGRGVAELDAVRDLGELWREMALEGFATSVRARREADAVRAAVLGTAQTTESADRDALQARADREARVARQITAGKVLDRRVAEARQILARSAGPTGPAGTAEGGQAA